MNSRTLRILAVVLAGSAILLGYFGLRLSQEAPEPAVEAEPAPAPAYDLQVVIARQDIEAGTAVAAKDLESIPVPVRRKGAFSLGTELVGRVPVMPIAAGEIVHESHFHPGSPMARLLARGERAVAISVTEVIGGGGYVQPGDHVDVLLYLRGGNAEVKRTVARTLLQRVQVLAYGKALAVNESGRVTLAEDAGKRTETTSRSAVLAVPKAEVEKLMLAENAGVIRLSLVSSQEADQPADAAREKPVGLHELAAEVRAAPVTSIPIHRGGSRTLTGIPK